MFLSFVIKIFQYQTNLLHYSEFYLFPTATICCFVVLTSFWLVLQILPEIVTSLELIPQIWVQWKVTCWGNPVLTHHEIRFWENHCINTCLWSYFCSQVCITWVTLIIRIHSVTQGLLCVVGCFRHITWISTIQNLFQDFVCSSYGIRLFVFWG